MKKPITIMLIVMIGGFISSQTMVKLKLPNNCNTNITKVNDVSIDKVSNLELYPNPNSGNFTLIMSFHDIIDKALINVYDTKGKSVYKETVYSDSDKLIKQLHIGGLLAGTYVLEVKTAKYISSTKLVINK